MAESLTRVPRVRVHGPKYKSWAVQTAFQTVRHRFNIYMQSCVQRVAMVLYRTWARYMSLVTHFNQ